jgi:hypothetical protein
MPAPTRRRALALAGPALATPAIARTKQPPGVTGTEPLIGQTMPYSGPSASYAPIGKVEVAYMFTQCGQDPSRGNIMRQAANLDIQLPMFQAGIRHRTAATDYLGINRLRLRRFNGKARVPFGDPIPA